MPNGSHECPRNGCDKVVPDRQFCCFEDWLALSTGARLAIQQTAQHSVLSDPRRAAIQRAVNEWGTL